MAFRLLLLAVALCASAAGGEESFRSRVMCDPVSGFALRYPYEYATPDQYAARVVRSQGGGREFQMREVTIDGKKTMVMVPVDKKVDANGISAFGVLGAELPSDAGITQPSIEAIGDWKAGEKLAWSSWDYYQTPDRRPHADPKWAPAGIVAMLGKGARTCALVCKLGDRYLGVVASGKPEDQANVEIFASFEVLNGGPGNTRFKQPLTWREGQWRQNAVIDKDGKIVRVNAGAAAGTGVDWNRCWEVETAHYHITCNSSPARLLQHAVYLEALYAAYSGVFAPEVFPPFKLEVHIFDTFANFRKGSAALGVNIPVLPGSIIGGYFVPSRLSIAVYEESGQLGGKDFTVEHVLAHECSHQFLHVACNGSDHVPTWINEGLAVYFESGVFQGGKFQWRPPKERVDNLKGFYQSQKSTLWPLENYIKHGAHIAAAQYAEVYAMTHFWLYGACKSGCKHNGEGRNACGLRRFRDYWKSLKAGKDGGEMFEKIFLEDMIRAKGGRGEALDAWAKALLPYVASGMAERLPSP